MSRRPVFVAVSVLSVGLLLAGCGGGSSPTTTSSTTSTTTAQASGGTCYTGGTAIDVIPVKDRSPKGTPGVAPTVTVPNSPAPSALQCADLIVGTGKAAKANNSVNVEYVLATYSTHGVVQSSWTSQPFSFNLGQGQVIPGWDEGVLGMRVGGRRELIIPPSLGYGDQSPGAGIAANDTLVFVVDVLSIN